MNHYQISGVVILIGLCILAAITFWPNVLTPSTAVVDNVATTTDATDTKPSATKSKPATKATAGAGARTYEKGVYVTTVMYTDAGFVPNRLEVAHGEEVRFINRSTEVMHVIADDKASSQYYRTINQPNTVGKNGTYQISLPEPGLFSLYNLNSSPRQTAQFFVK